MVPKFRDPELETLVSGSAGPRPFVTVVIPTLNEERFIVRCLESLLA
jgi:cellulose synthase/poly-beta-1,6-N-acetylglucosamine synthase-like glycosyltransferase